MEQQQAAPAPTFAMVDVEGSSQVAAFGYDAATQTLRIRFKSGGEYDYLKFPPEKYTELCAASSIGSFLHSDVKGQYDFRRVEKKEEVRP